MAVPESRWLWQHPLLSVEERLLPSGEKRIIVHRGRFAAVCLLLYTAEGREAFLIVRQERPTAQMPFYEHPAGMLEPDESPVEAALRELAEETGWLLTPEDLIPLHDGAYYPSPAFWNEAGYFFAARVQVPPPVLQAYASLPSRQQADESLTLLLLTGEELIQKTHNLQTIAHTLLYYARFGAFDRKVPSAPTHDTEPLGGGGPAGDRKS